MISDHKLLLAIFAPKDSIPSLAPARMTFLLLAYQYEIVLQLRYNHCQGLNQDLEFAGGTPKLTTNVDSMV